MDRQAAARWQINVADIQDAIQTAVGGAALTQVLQGEEVYNLTLRYLPQYRDTRDEIANIRLLSPSGERVSLGSAQQHRVDDGGQRSTAKATSATSPSNTACADAIWGAPSTSDRRGRAEGQASRRLPSRLGRANMRASSGPTALGHHRAGHAAADGLHPLHRLRIMEVGFLILAVVALSPLGGFLGLLMTGTHFSVSSGRWISGPHRSFCRNRRHHDRVHQPAPHARPAGATTRRKKGQRCVSVPS